MAESTPAFPNDPSVGPNDAAYAARAETAAQQAAKAQEPAGDFDIAVAQAPSESPTAPESPAPLAGKFKDAAELEKAYLELQKKLGDKPATEAPAAEGLIGPEALAGFVEEYRGNGTLSEDSYGKLQKLGLSKSVVDAYIEGQKAVVERQAESVYASVGGKEAFSEILAWAATGLPAEDREAFNGIMASGDLKAASFAVRNLAARFSQENGKPNRIEGKAVAAPSGFRSKAEMIAAMTDPRYQRDSAYRQEVSRKMASSQFVDG